MQTPRFTRGMTFIETLVASAVFLLVAVSLYQAYISIFQATSASRVKLSAASLASELFEIVRNMPYSDVGVVGSIPAGDIPNARTLVRDGYTFIATTTIRNVDDPFDGTIGGSPNDTAPADYRLVQVDIDCPACKDFAPMVFTTRVGPRTLEGSSNNGALFIQVYDANGVPVQDAEVHVENNATTSPITINDVTNASGMLQLVDVPPGTNAYEISVTKDGYSTDMTYPTGDVENPNPTKPHATVAAQQVTQVSFVIDLVSVLNVESVTQTCAAVPSLDFTLSGTKLIGSTPDVVKYEETHMTDSSGDISIEDLEWDTYILTVTDAAYDLGGLIPLLPPTLAPNSNLDMQLVAVPKDPNALLVTVKDAVTGLPVSDATVTLDSDEEQTTGRGFLLQTDWSGGSGQELYVDANEYFTDDGGVETEITPGVIELVSVASVYLPEGNLTSSVFDTGSASNFYQLLWQPADQPVSAGVDSVRFQVATANEVTATTTWEYLGPDGTSATYYTVSDQNINSVHSGDRYFRYKVFLSTEDTAVTPTISDVSFVFTSQCVPPGQVVFSDLSNGTHSIEVTATGYQSYPVTPVSVSSAFVSHEISLIPE